MHTHINIMSLPTLHHATWVRVRMSLLPAEDPDKWCSYCKKKKVLPGIPESHQRLPAFQLARDVTGPQRSAASQPALNYMDQWSNSVYLQNTPSCIQLLLLICGNKWNSFMFVQAISTSKLILSTLLWQAVAFQALKLKLFTSPATWFQGVNLGPSACKAGVLPVTHISSPQHKPLTHGMLTISLCPKVSCKMKA